MGKVKKLSRRSFLRAGQYLIPLPFLEIMLPSKSSAAVSPLRFVNFYVGNGTHRGEPSAFSAETIKAVNSKLWPHDFLGSAISSVKGDIVGYQGIKNSVVTTNPHAQCLYGYATGYNLEKDPKKTSWDQFISQKISTNSPLILGPAAGAVIGNDAKHHLTYSMSGRGVTGIESAPDLFQDVFKSIVRAPSSSNSGSEPDPNLLKRKDLQLSLLDSALDEIHSLKKILGKSDNIILDDHLQSFEDALDDLNKLDQEVDVGGDEEAKDACTTQSQPGKGSNYGQQLDLMVDLLALALRCNLTQVSTFMLNSENDGRGTAPDLRFLPGVTSQHHSLTHDAPKGEADRSKQLFEIDKFFLGRWVRLIEKLKGYQEPGGSVLDNSMLVYTSGMASGAAHMLNNIGFVVAGQAGGKFQTGRTVKYNSPVPVAQVQLTLMQLLGLNINQFGRDGTKTVKI